MVQIPNADAGDAPLRATLPQNLIYAGVVVGLVLVFLGIGLLAFGRGSQLSALMTCVGFGLVLAAFGSTAKGEWAGWTVTGAGALAIVLFLVLQHYQPVLSPHYKKGQLRGDFAKVADLRIIDEQPMYEYRDRTTSSIRFVLLEKKLKSSRLSLQVDTTEKGDGKEFFELTGDADKVQEKYLADSVDNDRPIQWTFDYDKRVVKDGQETIFAERESLEGALIAPKKLALLDRTIELLLPSARAQDAPAAKPVSKAGDLIEQLKSDDTATRRNARDSLASLDTDAVDPMMAALRANPGDYRIRLGVLYSLDEMLRHDPGRRTKISSVLQDQDFPLLVKAASDNDKTIRMQAAEFLYLLQDSRAVTPSIEAARSTADNAKATNQVLIIKQASQALPSQAREDVVRDLTEGPGLNNDLVGTSGLVRQKLGF